MKRWDTKEVQRVIDETFKENFGYTPLNERLKDIQREFFELMKWTDVKNLKEEAGDLLSSLIQLHTENDWDIEENITSTLLKIKNRSLQYKTLGRKVSVAIYGGAFDPITFGHIQVAQFILNSSGQFDEVWLMPTYKHMYNKEMASPEHRIKMCELAAQVDRRIRVFDYEIKHQLAGETYYFVKKLKEEKELNDNYHFSMVIGLDNANTFDKWVNYDLLERLIRFVVVQRKGYEVQRDAWYFNPPHIFLQGESTKVKVSSTTVRNMVLRGRAEDHTELLKLIPQTVFNYIIQHSLYQ